MSLGGFSTRAVHDYLVGQGVKVSYSAVLRHVRNHLDTEPGHNYNSDLQPGKPEKPAQLFEINVSEILAELKIAGDITLPDLRAMVQKLFLAEVISHRYYQLAHFDGRGRVPSGHVKALRAFADIMTKLTDNTGHQAPSENMIKIIEQFKSGEIDAVSAGCEFALAGLPLPDVIALQIRKTPAPEPEPDYGDFFDEDEIEKRAAETAEARAKVEKEKSEWLPERRKAVKEMKDGMGDGDDRKSG